MKPNRLLHSGAPPVNKTQLLDKYPVFVEEIAKTDTHCANVDDVVARLRDRVQAQPGASEIAVFDHLVHVKAQPEGKVADGIRGSIAMPLTRQPMTIKSCGRRA